ncbi:hypothetical protein Hanom_Chr08g00736961 [Helianthus anomalus]
MTILYRMWKPEQYKYLIVSPQQIINKGIRSVTDLAPHLTSLNGLYNMMIQPYLYVYEAKFEQLNRKMCP